MEFKKTSFIEKLGNIPTKWIYLLIILAFVIPVLYPIQTPFSVKESTMAVYNTIESLPDGSIVVIGGSNAYGFHVEIKECLQVALVHLFSKNLKVIFVAFAADTQMFHSIVRQAVGISPDKPFNGKIYGVDWVDLGYITGAEGALAAFAKNPKIVKIDAYGTSTDNLPIMKEMSSADTWGLYIDDSGNFVAQAVRQVVVPFKTKMVVLNTAGWYPTHVPYVQSGLIQGQTMGIRGAAEYEQLMGIVGLGHSGIDTINMINILIIVLVLLGNLSYFGRYITKRKEVEA